MFYEEPKFEVILLEEADIICSSGGTSEQLMYEEVGPEEGVYWSDLF